MRKYSKGVITKVAVCVSTAILLVSSASAAADRDVMNRMERMERELQTINRAIFKEGKGRLVQKNKEPSSMAAFDDRINNIENDNREVINKLEKLNYDMRMLKDEFKRMQADYEQRFQELSGKRMSTPVATTSDSPDAPTKITRAKPIYEEKQKPIIYKHGDAEKLYNKAFSEIKASKYDEAEKSFNDFIAAHPDHQLSPNAYYWLGETHYVRGDYKMAAKAFARCFQKYPDSSKALDSLLKLGLSLSTLDKKQDACLSFAQLQKQSNNPRSPIHRRAIAEAEKINCK